MTQERSLFTRHIGAALAAVLALAGPLRADDATPAASPSKYKLTPGPSATPELLAAVKQGDAALFASIFDDCDAKRVRALVTDDFEFYHDKHGQTSDTGDAFAASIAAMCERRATGEDFIARRELVESSLRIYPMKDYGAVEIGTHRFYKIEAGKPEVLTEVSQFTNLWKQQDGQWRLARTLSYDHQLNPDY